MPWKDKNTLKGFFKNGNNPSQAHFADLIDSTVNKIDDGFAKNIEDGLQLSPLGNSNKLMSFYEDIRDTQANWQISINPEERAEGLAFSDSDNHYRFFLAKNGNVGVGTPYPRTRLDVRGTSALNTRVGGYLVGKVKADGAWHVVMEKLADCQAFEIMAKVLGRQKRGQYAMAHAIALNVFGKGKIKVTQSHYGMFWNKIRFRWKGESNNYRLEMKTATDYGKDKDRSIYIHYHVARLWDDRMFFKEHEESKTNSSGKK